MTAEPYICIKGPPVGEICWLAPHSNPDERPDHRYLVFVRRNMKELAENLDASEQWQPYADFEREKQKAIGGELFIDSGGVSIDGVYFFIKDVDMSRAYKMDSQELIGYRLGDYDADSESSRLLKRAEFLKAVCEKEGVAWLPQDLKGKLWMGEDESNLKEIGTVTKLEFKPGRMNVEWEKKPERDSYTKKEIDERVGELLTHVESLAQAVQFLGDRPKEKMSFISPSADGKSFGTWQEKIRALRHRFLP